MVSRRKPRQQEKQTNKIGVTVLTGWQEKKKRLLFASLISVNS